MLYHKSQREILMINSYITRGYKIWQRGYRICQGIQNVAAPLPYLYPHTVCGSLPCHILYPHTLCRGYIINSTRVHARDLYRIQQSFWQKLFSISFCLYAAFLWNSLPFKLRNSPSVTSISKHLKTHLFNSSFPTQSPSLG